MADPYTGSPDFILSLQFDVDSSKSPIEQNIQRLTYAIHDLTVIQMQMSQSLHKIMASQALRDDEVAFAEIRAEVARMDERITALAKILKQGVLNV